MRSSSATAWPSGAHIHESRSRKNRCRIALAHPTVGDVEIRADGSEVVEHDLGEEMSEAEIERFEKAWAAAHARFEGANRDPIVAVLDTAGDVLVRALAGGDVTADGRALAIRLVGALFDLGVEPGAWSRTAIGFLPGR